MHEIWFLAGVLPQKPLGSSQHSHSPYIITKILIWGSKAGDKG